MPNTNAPCFDHGQALLLIEPNTTEYSERAQQLDRSKYCVSRADNLHDIFLMRKALFFTVAVLSDMVGSLALRASAQIVRAQWPRARILILGKAPIQFDDHLYDESVLHGADEYQLLSVINKLLEDPWNHKGHDAYAEWLVRGSIALRSQQKCGESRK